MKKIMRRIWILALLTGISSTAWAQDEPSNEETPAVKVDLNETYTGGKVEVTKYGEPAADGSVEVTITVTPDDGYYITKDDILVVPTIPIGSTRDTNPGFADALPLSGEDPADKKLSREYTFTVPSGLGAWVKEAVFHSADDLYDISGDTSSEVTWKFDDESATLTITGKGVTKDFGKEGEVDPLEAYRSVMTAVVITEDVTSLGANIFKGCTALTSITIENAKEVVALGEDALPENEGLKVVVPANLLNAYWINDAWKAFKVDNEKAVEMKGIKFSASNKYVAYAGGDEALEVPSVLKAYIITGISEKGLELTEVSVITPGMAVLLFNAEDLADTDFFTGVTIVETKGEATNLLKIAPKGGQEVKLGEVYVLYNDVFYYTQAGTIPEGNIYLTTPSTLTKTRSSYTVGTRGDTTAIDDVLYINKVEAPDAWYGLDGRQYTTMPTHKGIYIKNGIKVVIK